ncbi:restriction endonuclease subunit S [Bacteroides finegoldii]|uniref:restriction endonuclease subunit S n=1 Tax=Bacteroides finegoldii TaxID=338188 RepID=UPI0032EC5975
MANNNNTKNLNVPNLRFPEFKGEWEKCKLEECVVFLDGKRKPIKSSERVSEQKLYPYYGASGIIDYIDDYLFDGKFILLSEDGANILDRNYRVAFIAEGKIWVNNHAHVLQSNDNIDINFIAEKLESLDYSIYNTGTTMPKLNQEVCRNIPLWLPPTEEQVKIGTLLSLLNERITTQSKIIEKYESLIKGINEKLLINKKEYTTYRLSDICEIRSGYSGTQLTGTQGLMVSRIETISKHCINLDKVGYVKPFDSSADFKLHIGDILFSNINSVQYIGNTAFVDREYDLYHGMNLLRLIPRKIVEPFYVFLLLNTAKYKIHFQSICNKAISQASINQTELGKTVIHIPDLLYQKQICQLFNSLYNKKNIENLYLQAL